MKPLHKVFLTLTVAFTFFCTYASAQVAADYIPLDGDMKYAYKASFQRVSTGEAATEKFSVISKNVIRGGKKITYFIEEQALNKDVAMLDVNMIGLGAYEKGPDGLYTYDCTWLKDLEKIPPKRPHLFLPNELTPGSSVRVVSDTGSQIFVFTVVGFERITVPAGVFEDALKVSVKQLRPDGRADESFAWFAKNVGLIKRIRDTGRVEELVSVEKADLESFSTKPIQSWVGLRFVFLPKQRMFQRYGYQSVHPVNNDRQSLPYEKYRGKIAVVKKITPFTYGWRVLLAIEGTNELVQADAYKGTVQGIAPLSDIENARAKYKGKTLLARGAMYTYNEELDETGVISLMRPTQVKVVDVVPGWEANSPVRFVLEAPNGFNGYIDVHMSDTNIADTLRQYNRFEDVFNPEKTRKELAIEGLEKSVEEMDQRIKEQQDDYRKFSALSDLDTRAGRLRNQLSDLRQKEIDLKARLENVNYDLQPENLRRSALSTKDNIEQRRQRLTDEKSRLESQIGLISESEKRIETELNSVESELEKARKGLGRDASTDSDTELQPADSQAKTIEVGSLDNKTVRKPIPKYPATARAARIAGVVQVNVVVDEQGRVTSIRSSSGPALLRAAAEAAALETTFQPIEVEGKPARVSGTLTFEFSLP